MSVNAKDLAESSVVESVDFGVVGFRLWDGIQSVEGT